MNPDHPRQRSSKFESLVQFLDNQNHENANPSSSSSENKHDERERLADGSNSNAPRGGAGLVDVTNVTKQSSNEPTAEKLIYSDEKDLQSKFVGSNDSEAPPTEINKLTKIKKSYIWDTFILDEENIHNHDAESDKRKDQTAGESQAEKMSIARQQILDIQEASKEISSRAAKLKADQEKLKAEVERLHSIRIQNEANHVKAMKKLKLEFKDRRAAIEAKSEQVSGGILFANYLHKCSPQGFFLYPYWYSRLRTNS